MVSISTRLAQLILGPGIGDRLDHLEAEYAAGNRIALLEAIAICSLRNCLIPEWARFAFVKTIGEIEGGRLKNLDEAFGWKSRGPKTRRKARHLSEVEKTVFAQLVKHRSAGGNFSSADGLQQVSDELGMPRRTVEAIYRRHQAYLLKLQPGDEPGWMMASVSLLSFVTKSHPETPPSAE